MDIKHMQSCKLCALPVITKMETQNSVGNTTQALGNMVSVMCTEFLYCT